MRLSHLTDKILLKDIKNLVMNERGLTTQILHHLREIDTRKLYSDLGRSSLFDYCVGELGYSESSAQRRIVAARMLGPNPEIEKKIESGVLTLSNISLVNQFFKETDERTQALKVVEGLSKKDCEKKLFEMTGEEIPCKEKKKRVSDNKIQVSIVLDDEANEALEEIKKLLGKKMSSSELIKFMARAAKKEIERSKFKQTQSPRSPAAVVVTSRSISSKVKREVYRRDNKCLKCGSTHNLNFDHRQAFAMGGDSGLGNIRLLCFNCNQRSRIKMKLHPARPP